MLIDFNFLFYINIIKYIMISLLDLALVNAKNADETKLLIDAGADVNAKNYCGWTALMIAKNSEQTKLLIKGGVDVNVRDDLGRTALMVAKTAEQTKLLIEAGANVDAKDNIGWTALIYAKTAEQTKLLIDAVGARAGEAAKAAYVNAKSGHGSTALNMK
jgi:ankyrin repeat protein